MTQSGGNGNKPDINPDDMTTYEPAYAPEDDTEHVGWWETEPGQKGKFIPELPPDLDEPEPPTSN